MEKKKGKRTADWGGRGGVATVQENWFQPLYSPLSRRSTDDFVSEQVPVASVKP